MSWSEVKKINSNMAKPLDTTITEAQNDIKNNIANVLAVLNNFVNTSQNGGVKVVKSVQRGVINIPQYQAASISVSYVNPNTSILLLDGVDSYTEINIQSFDGWTIVLATAKYTRNIRWQVVEFY